MGKNKPKSAYRTKRHAFVPLNPDWYPSLKDMTGFPQAKVFYAVIDTIPGPEGRHHWHLLRLADSLGIYKPAMVLWKGMSALILPGNNKMKLAKLKGVKSMTPDELDDVMLSYHAHKIDAAVAEDWKSSSYPL